MPELPAYVLFLCIRHADHCRDEPRAHSLLDAAINAIKRVMKVLGAGKLLGDKDGMGGAAAWTPGLCRMVLWCWGWLWGRCWSLTDPLSAHPIEAQ